jgi:hypothetical protein
VIGLSWRSAILWVVLALLIVLVLGLEFLVDVGGDASPIPQPSATVDRG